MISESISTLFSHKIPKYYQEYRPEPDSSQWVKLSDKVSKFVSDLLTYLNLESMIPLWSLMTDYYQNQEIEKLEERFRASTSDLKSFEEELINKGTLVEKSRPSHTIPKEDKYPLCLRFIISARKSTFTDSVLAALPVTSWVQNYQKNRLSYFYGYMSSKAEDILEDLKSKSVK